MDLDHEWARCGYWLKRGMARSDEGHTLTMARAEVDAGKTLFWPGKHSAALTETTRDMHIWAAGGDLKELIEMERACCDWSRAQGFDRMTIEGRRGWERALPGYRMLLVKDL
jgi:hypothetical protein